MAFKAYRARKFGRFMKRQKTSRAGARASRRRAYPRQRTIRSSGLRSAVKATISRMTENKKAHIRHNIRAIVGTANAAVFDANIIPIGCQAGAYEIEQGVGMSQRIGNKITVKRATLKGTIFINGYNATTNPTLKPHHVKMFLFYDKENPQSIPAPDAAGDFYDYENTTSGFQNSLVDLWGDINTERYRVVVTRTFKLGSQYTAQAGTGVSTGPTNFANNDFKMNANFSINYTKHLPKTQVFKDNNIDSTSRQLYCMWLPILADGNPVFSGVSQSSVSYAGKLEYEDA